MQLNLHFKDENESFYLIKFGKKEHLEQIQNGVVRFSSLEKYRQIENKAIGDKYEGLESISYKNKNTQISFLHPAINREIDITDSVHSLAVYPNKNIFISCFSYFTKKDIIEHTIFSEKILKESEWESVLFIIDSNRFVDNLANALSEFNCKGGKVEYIDLSVNQDSLDEFTKSLEFEYQKELRFSLRYRETAAKHIRKTDDCTLEVMIDKVDSVIVPAKDFRESFFID